MSGHFNCKTGRGKRRGAKKKGRKKKEKADKGSEMEHNGRVRSIIMKLENELLPEKRVLHINRLKHDPFTCC